MFFCFSVFFFVRTYFILCNHLSYQGASRMRGRLGSMSSFERVSFIEARGGDPETHSRDSGSSHSLPGALLNSVVFHPCSHKNRSWMSIHLVLFCPPPVMQTWFCSAALSHDFKLKLHDGTKCLYRAVSKTMPGRWLRCVSAVQNVEQSFAVMLPSIGTRLEHQLCPESQTSVSAFQCSAAIVWCANLDMGSVAPNDARPSCTYWKSFLLAASSSTSTTTF